MSYMEKRVQELRAEGFDSDTAMDWARRDQADEQRRIAEYQVNKTPSAILSYWADQLKTILNYKTDEVSQMLYQVIMDELYGRAITEYAGTIKR